MKRLFSFILVGLLVFVLFGCSSGNVSNETTSGSDANTNASTGSTANDSQKAQEEKKELTKVTVGYMPNYASLNKVVAGMYTGAFEEQGIKVELVEFADGPTIIAALESGSLDIGYIGPGAHVLPIQGKSKIFAFSQLGNSDEVIGNTDKGVSSITDLKGKTIAVAVGTSSEAILDLTLNEAGLTKKDVTVVNMDASAIVTAMISGSVDAAATWSPNTNTIKKELGDKAIMLSNNARYAEIFPSIASWVVKPEFAEKNTDLLIRYTKGLYKAMDYLVDNTDQVAEWVAKEIAVDLDSVLAQTGDGEWITSAELIKRIKDGTLEKYYKAQQENFVEVGRLTKEDLKPVSDYVLFDIMLKAGE